MSAQMVQTELKYIDVSAGNICSTFPLFLHGIPAITTIIVLSDKAHSPYLIYKETMLSPYERKTPLLCKLEGKGSVV